MNAKLLSEKMNELAVLLQDHPVVVKDGSDRIKIFPTNDDGEISHLYPICEPTIDRIIKFCRINNLNYFIAEDVYTTCVCFQIYQSKLD